MNDVLEAMEKVTSVAYTADASIEISGSGQPNQGAFDRMKLLYEGSGVSNAYDDTLSLDQFVLEGRHKITFQTEIESQPFTTGIDFDLKMKESVIYAKFSELPNLFLIDLTNAPFRDSWIKLDLKNSSSTEEDFEMLRGIISGDVSESSISRDKIVGIYRQHPFLEVNNVVSKRNAQNIPVHEIDFTLNKEQFIQYASKMTKLSASEELSSEYAAQSETELREMLNDLTDLSIKADIGRKDKMLYAFTFSGKVSNVVEGDPTEAVFKINAAFKDYNRPVQISIPTDARPIEEVIEEVSASFENMYLSL